jgi:host factor-I protein
MMSEQQKQPNKKPAADSLQNQFIEEQMAKCLPVSVYLVNGIRLTGVIIGMDNYTLLISGNSSPQLVYKAAISTIAPAGPNVGAARSNGRD